MALTQSTIQRAHFIFLVGQSRFPVAKLIYARISLFYEDNRNQFSWFLFPFIWQDQSHFEDVMGVNASVHRGIYPLTIMRSSYAQ